MSSLASPPLSEPICPLCRGTGWRMIAVSASETRATRCDCQLAQRVQRLLENAAIPPRYFHCTLDDLDLYPGCPDSLREARMMALLFVDNYPSDRNGLLFMGPCGVGKTHLAIGIIRKLMLEKGIGCKFADYRELLKRIQRTFDPQNPASEASVVEPLLDVEVLVLDDLGVGRATEWALEMLHYLLNHRYSHERTTILTTNLEDTDPRRSRLADGSEFESGKGLAQSIGVRLRSRLYEMCRPVVISGEDFRRRNLQTGVIERARDDANRFY